MRTPISSENDNITAEFHRDLHKITERGNIIRHWFYNYSTMTVGFLLVVAAFILFVLHNRELSQSISEMAPSPDIAKANIDKIAILLSISSIKMACIWGLMALGVGFLGIGLALYIHNNSNRTTRLFMLASEYTGRTLLRAINEYSLQHLNETAGNQNTSSKTDERKKKGVKK